MAKILRSTKIFFAVALVCAIVSITVLTRFWIRQRHCRLRADAFQARANILRREATLNLKIGTSKDDVAKFFEDRRIPYSFDHFGPHNDARGTIDVPGDKECNSWVCGTDSALIGIDIKVDDAGNVISPPQVITMYTDCL